MTEQTEGLCGGSGDRPLDLRQSPAREAFGFLLAMAAHRFRVRFEQELEPMGVQVKHFTVLATIDHFGPVAQQRLGESVCIDRSSMVVLLDEMEKRDLVQRRPDPVDRRAHRVYLTDSGKEVLRRANRLIKGVEDSCLEPLQASERAELKRMLQQIVDLGGVSGFEHINIKVSGRSGDGPGRIEAAPAGTGEGQSR